MAKRSPLRGAVANGLPLNVTCPVAELKGITVRTWPAFAPLRNLISLPLIGAAFAPIRFVAKNDVVVALSVTSSGLSVTGAFTESDIRKYHSDTSRGTLA